MTDDMRDDWGDDGGLGPRLDAYAAARLTADPVRTRLARERVVADARLGAGARGSAAAAPGAPAAGPSTTGRPRVPVRAAFPRRFRGLVLAAAALMVALAAVGGALAASGTGGPLYAARLWFEQATLPTDPEAKLDAQVRRLEARLREAEEAAAAGNGAAVTAALEAYRAIADAAAGDAGVDASQREHIAAQIGRHVAVLEALADEVPARAAEAIEAAIERTENRIEEILATPPGEPVAPGKPEGPAKPESPGKTDGPGKPEATPDTGPTATPGRTPPGKPEATPKPVRSPAPDKTPPGQVDRTPSPAP